MSKSQIVANGQIAFRADHRYVYRKESFNNSLKITADPDDEVLSMMPYSNQTHSSPGYQKDSKHKHINYNSKKHIKRGMSHSKNIFIYLYSTYIKYLKCKNV